MAPEKAGVGPNESLLVLERAHSSAPEAFDDSNLPMKAGDGVVAIAEDDNTA